MSSALNIKMQISIKPVYTIGVAAGLLGVSVHLLRVYEKEGLILPHRTETGRRLFSDLEIEKVNCIRRLINKEGMNYEGIKRLFALVPCWKIRQCSEEKRSQCVALKNYEKPCWATTEKCAHPLPSCRDCIIYRTTVDCADLKALIYGHSLDK
jgi:MerR family transcriptional regulator, heat shock protein HspR